MKPAALPFDLVGTLIDSMPQHNDAWVGAKPHPDIVPDSSAVDPTPLDIHAPHKKETSHA